jgi:hypothetical protein
VTRHHRWIAILGDQSYNLLVRLNIYLSWLRRTLKRPGYWSLAGYAKRKVKTAINFIFNFEESVIRHAREKGLDGAICGHIHWPMIKDVDGLTYINCGDWVDSCTAIVEHLDGRMELIQWNRAVVPATRCSPPDMEPMESPHKEQDRIRRLLNAFGYSCAGLQEAFRNEDAFARGPAGRRAGCRWLLCGKTWPRSLDDWLRPAAADRRAGQFGHRGHGGPHLAGRPPAGQARKDIGSAAVLLSLVNLALVWAPVLLR